MTAKELKRIFQKGECLSLDTMKLYSDGKLNKKSMHEVEKHLVECGLCSGAMDGLNAKRLAEVNKLSSHIQRRLAVYMNTPPPVPFMRRFGLAIGAGILLIGASVATWYFTTHSHSNDLPIRDSVQHTPIENSIIKPGTTPENSNSSSIISPDRSIDLQNSTLVQPNSDDKNQKIAGNTMQDLPATQPGVPNSLTVTQAEDQKNVSSGSGDGSTSRTANTNSFIHVKSVLVYPPVTHNPKSGRKESHDGQLGRSESGNADFKMEDMPTYPGGDQALKSYIASNFKNVAMDKNKLTRYATGVLIVVNSKTGEVSAPELSYSLSPEIDTELMRVLKAMPNWNPGKKKGEVDVMIGVTFE